MISHYGNHLEHNLKIVVQRQVKTWRNLSLCVKHFLFQRVSLVRPCFALELTECKRKFLALSVAATYMAGRLQMKSNTLSEQYLLLYLSMKTHFKKFPNISLLDYSNDMIALVIFILLCISNFCRNWATRVLLGLVKMH